ncbi:FANCM [Mytilus edulis]|uniref:FANCM n=1 Tax=Mytilus edulis TaxID=6550 RepID=A0A8S3T905_MYTED|nr:FANCM [Mytilus edulis]
MENIKLQTVENMYNHHPVRNMISNSMCQVPWKSLHDYSDDGGHTANDGRQTDNDGHEGTSDVCNISIGAESFPVSTQGLTQTNVPPGFDRVAGKLWIYPTNYSVREYQYNIVGKALLKNTMVTLPTGLGKTFIAAARCIILSVVSIRKSCLYGLTKPLVAQQIEACYNIMGVPQEDTAEMTVIMNDLSRGTCPAVDVRCLVIDEAHKATGNHAYCQAVQQVLANLLISHIEIRTEESPDIKPYSHERKVDKIVVPLGDELTSVKKKYVQILDVTINKLKRHGVIYNRDTTSFSKFLILKAREDFRQNPPPNLQRNNYGMVEGDFALALSLYHGFELLQLHGSRSLFNYLDGILHGDKGYGRTKTELLRNHDFNELMDLLREKFAPPDCRPSQSSKKPLVTGHPKMEKLEQVVLDHFNTFNSGDGETRVMIFSQYRDSVSEITNILKQHHPLVKVMSFIGQSSAGKSTKGFTQKEQLKVMKDFREGGYNTLVSTCVGEEGLDIGDVDLIVCFDAHKSPIVWYKEWEELAEREGRIVMLVTEGKEEQIYNQSQYSKKSIHKAILNSAKTLHFYQNNPAMVPDDWTPKCHKMFITVSKKFKPSKAATHPTSNQ